MLLKVNEELFENPVTVLISMEQEFKDGCHSPFLYLECQNLHEKEPGFLKNMARFELYALYFGAKRGMVSRDLALAAAKALNGAKGFKEIYLKLVCRLYEMYPDQEILSSVCSMMI